MDVRMCGRATLWNNGQQHEGMNYRFTRQCGWLSNALRQVRDPGIKPICCMVSFMWISIKGESRGRKEDSGGRQIELVQRGMKTLLG